MLYKVYIFGSLGSPFDYGTSVPNSPVVQGPSSHGGLNDNSTSCPAGPEEVATIESPPIDHVPCYPSPNNPDADCGNSCPCGPVEVGVETPIVEKVLGSPSPRVPSAPIRSTQHFETTWKETIQVMLTKWRYKNEDDEQADQIHET
ncbi:hypothetical protein R1flu_013441 [Riccia fluitans]|uniref:Uncharacterized protein n=1 Tax=Riccia fluitans TaxID=41844 RepID=A0ABD1YDL8_9MARC